MSNLASSSACSRDRGSQWLLVTRLCFWTTSHPQDMLPLLHACGPRRTTVTHGHEVSRRPFTMASDTACKLGECEISVPSSQIVVGMSNSLTATDTSDAITSWPLTLAVLSLREPRASIARYVSFDVWLQESYSRLEFRTFHPGYILSHGSPCVCVGLQVKTYKRVVSYLSTSVVEGVEAEHPDSLFF